MSSSHPIQVGQGPERGFTLIELMIVIAIIAIILTLALPVYSNYTIRAKVGEALSITAAAKTATGATCQEEPNLPSLSNDRVGWAFGGSTYVESIEISGPCSDPIITIVTRNTGAKTDPILTLTGQGSVGTGRFSWTCATAEGQNIHVPRSCRS
jgi:type IV pilus assembly protein PilA